MIDSIFSKNILKYIKYIVVGGIGAITDFSIYTLFVKYFQINFIIANIFSMSVALIIVYFLQKNWTFKYQTKEKRKTFQRYLISVIITFLLNNFVLFTLVDLFGYNEIFAKIVQIIIGTIWGYCLTNFFVFNKKWDNR